MENSYTKDEMYHIATQLASITVQGLPVFRVDILHGYTHEPVGLNTAPDKVYLKIANKHTVGNMEFHIKDSGK